MNYELHTTTPESVILAGGTYMTEDCWVSPGYPGCDYFYFQLDEGGTRTYLYHGHGERLRPRNRAVFLRPWPTSSGRWGCCPSMT